MAKIFSYDRLLGSLYSSIAAPDSLVDFLEELNLGTRSHVGVVLAHDYATGSGALPTIVGLPTNAVVEYERRYGAEPVRYASNSVRCTDTVVSLEAALNRVALAVIFIDAHGQVARINHGAERMLRNGDVITLCKGRIVARDSIDAHWLDHAVTATTRAASTAGIPLPPSARLTLRNAAGVPAAFASVRPLTTGAVAHADDKLHCTIVFIRSGRRLSAQCVRGSRRVIRTDCRRSASCR
jgi:hypothetical protein